MKDDDNEIKILEEIENRYDYKEEDFPIQEMFYSEILGDIYIKFQLSYIRLEDTIELLEKNENKFNKETQALIDDYIDEYRNIGYELTKDYLLYDNALSVADINYHKTKKDEKTKSTYKRFCRNIIEERIKKYKKAGKLLIILSDKLNNIK